LRAIYTAYTRNLTDDPLRKQGSDRIHHRLNEDRKAAVDTPSSTGFLVVITVTLIIISFVVLVTLLLHFLLRNRKERRVLKK
jgi:Flp pilus assembly protein TadB